MLIPDDQRDAVAIELVTKTEHSDWQEQQSAQTRIWLDRAQFKGRAGQFVFLPDEAGAPNRLIAGVGDTLGFESVADLAKALPPGDYRLETERFDDAAVYAAHLGWGLGAYRFDEYRKAPGPDAARSLLVPEGLKAVLDEVASVSITRDLVNRPTEDLLPHDLESEARKLAIAFDADFECIVGDDLLRAGFATIHTVGRASVSAPRLIDIRWGEPDHPHVALVGKGVCFDSGGLDIKPANGMRQMKKDMGGAAHVLGLANLIMRRKLPVRLRVLVPAVENAISANAYRPGDVIRTYKGTTVEIDNTDAEGRLILCDALTLAVEEEPEIIVDFATLTGAARSALGTELPAMFTNRDDIATGISAAGEALDDPVWRMPLHAPYRKMLTSPIADLTNAPSSPYGGAITAALYLEHFVDEKPWVHFDIMAMNIRHRPGHPVGGEAMGLRAVFDFLAGRFGA